MSSFSSLLGSVHDYATGTGSAQGTIKAEPKAPSYSIFAEGTPQHLALQRAAEAALAERTKAVAVIPPAAPAPVSSAVQVQPPVDGQPGIALGEAFLELSYNMFLGARSYCVYLLSNPVMALTTGTAVAGAALGYSASESYMGPLAGFIGGLLLPKISTAVYAALPSAESVRKKMRRPKALPPIPAPRAITMDPNMAAVVHQLTNAGLDSNDLALINLQEVTNKMMISTPQYQNCLVTALAELKLRGVLTAANAQALLSSNIPATLAIAMAERPQAFASSQAREVLSASDNPGALARVIPLLTEAGLNAQDLAQIDLPEWMYKVPGCTPEHIAALVSALKELKKVNLVTKDYAKAIVNACFPHELALAIVKQPNAFLIRSHREAIFLSPKPQQLAYIISLLKEAGLIEKNNNLTTAATLDTESLKTIVHVLALNQILHDDSFNLVKRSKDVPGLAKALAGLNAAGLLQNEGTVLGRKLGLLEPTVPTGTVVNGECFLTVMNATNPASLAGGLIALKNAKLLSVRENFDAVRLSRDPHGTGRALAALEAAQLSLITKAESAALEAAKLLSSTKAEFDAVRKHRNPRALADVMEILNAVQLLTRTTFNQLISFGGNLGELARGLKRLQEGGFVPSPQALRFLISSQNPLALATIFRIIKEANLQDLEDSNVLLVTAPNFTSFHTLTNLAVALRKLQESGVIVNLKELVKRRKASLNDESTRESIRQMDKTLMNVICSGNPLVKAEEFISAHKLANAGNPAAAVANQNEQEAAERARRDRLAAAASAANQQLAQFGLADAKDIAAVDNALNPRDMSFALLRLKEHGQLNDQTREALISADKNEETQDLVRFADLLVL